MLFVKFIGCVRGSITLDNLDDDVIQATILGAAGVPKPQFFVIVFVRSLPHEVIGCQLRVHSLPTITIESYRQTPKGFLLGSIFVYGI